MNSCAMTIAGAAAAALAALAALAAPGARPGALWFSSAASA